MVQKSKRTNKGLFLKMRKSKKAYSTGFTWVFGLVSLFGLGIMYIVFSQVFDANLVPIIKNMVVNPQINNGIDNATQQEVISGIDKYMSFWNILPFVLFFVIVIYMVVTAIRKEREEQY